MSELERVDRSHPKSCIGCDFLINISEETSLRFPGDCLCGFDKMPQHNVPEATHIDVWKKGNCRRMPAMKYGEYNHVQYLPIKSTTIRCGEYARNGVRLN